MRKVLSLLLCVAMLCSLVVITAQADGAPAADFADAVAVPGGSVTINMNVANNPGLAAIKFVVSDDDALGVTFAGADYEDDTMGLTATDSKGTYFWSGAFNSYNATIGTLTITIPEDAELGTYNFTVTASQGGNESLQKVTVGNDTFTVTVTDKVITGVNVAIDAGLAIGVHVQAADIDGVSITAVNVAGKEYTTVEDYEEDEENGGYIFYLNVNPWAMDAEFVVDFTDNFAYGEEKEMPAVVDTKDTEDEEDDEVLKEAYMYYELDLVNLPATAKTTGILSYCEALLAGEPSDELIQLIADLLAYGQEAQRFKAVAVMALPAGLTPTVGEWLDGDENPTDFGTYCSENFPETIAKGNNTASQKFKFVDATIEFGAKFVVTFSFANNGKTTASTSARVVLDGETYSLDGWNFTYAFSPAQYAGLDVVLYATSTISNTNKAYTNTYGPAFYAAYAYDNGADEGLMDVLEAFYNYGVSVEAYVGSLGE